MATARELLTDDLLRANLQQFEIDAKLLSARRSAVAIGDLYRARSNTPRLTEQGVRIGSMVVDSNGEQPLFLLNTAAPNRVEVRLAADPDDPSTRLFLSGVTGVERARIAAHAVASLQNQVVEFRVCPECPIPMVPLAIPDDVDGVTAGCWSREIEKFGGADEWSWNDTEQLPARVSDHLPEIVISIRAGTLVSKAGQGTLVSFDTAQRDKLSLFNQVQYGIGSTASGFSDADTISFPCHATATDLSRTDLRTLASLLRSIMGQRRIFPLALATQSDADVAERSFPVVPLLRPVAARILDVQSSGNQLNVTLQPCVLSTATAVIADGNSTVPPNRYIWKIGLAE